METKDGLASRAQAAVARLESVLDACGEREAKLRCGRDSRTVASLTNHVADWLQLVAQTVTQVGMGRGRLLGSEVIAEIDAGLAKASAGRSWKQTRRRLAESSATLQSAITGLSMGDLHAALGNDAGVTVSVASYVQKFAVTHVQEHTAVIHAALLAAVTVDSRDQKMPRMRQERGRSEECGV